MAIYYIDPHCGCDCADGLSAEHPKKDWSGLLLQPGDTVAFKRGSFIRGRLETTAGVSGAPITYTAYGEGDLPAPHPAPGNHLSAFCLNEFTCSGYFTLVEVVF